MAEPRKYDKFRFTPPSDRLESGGDYIGYLRPTPNGQEERRDTEAYDPFPDLKVYLKAKGRQALFDWARAELPEIAAKRVKQFIADKDAKHLATLTEVERARLREQLVKHGLRNHQQPAGVEMRSR